MVVLLQNRSGHQMKTILITGSEGFVGKNLCVALQRQNNVEIITFDVHDDASSLETKVLAADMIYHLAGVNRPQKIEEFSSGNSGLTQTIVSILKNEGKNTPLVLSSSIQAALDNPYGRSKKEAEDAVFEYGRITSAPVYVYRMPNLFGKWCRPNYNSAVATFCHNIAHNLPIQVNDPNVVMNLAYIDDVVRSFISVLDGESSTQECFCQIQPIHTATLGNIAELIRSFKESRELRTIPDMTDPFAKKLYSTYLSYLPTDQFSYPLKMNRDDRGSFTEFIKSSDRGQVSINISKPGITKGNHWHNTKNEKFLVVSGVGVIRFRKIGSDDIVCYPVSGDKLEVVDIPCGYTHNITNTGETDMVTVMWANETFDAENPDTFFENVERVF